MNNHNISKTILILTTVILLAVHSLAWDNATIHKQINKHAFEVFNARYNSYADELGYRNAKFYHAGIDLNSKYNGPTVVSGGMWMSSVVHGVDDKTLSEWLEHGGYSADEPWIFMGSRHFYDPLHPNTPWLRDGSWATTAAQFSAQFAAEYLTFPVNLIKSTPVLADKQQEATNCNIDALSWAMQNDGNMYNYNNTQKWYREAMENGELTEEKRKATLALSFRALGETMHLLGDMVLPSHVRDDSHAPVNGDTIEDGMKPSYVEGAETDAAPLWKGPIPAGIDFKNQPPDKIFNELALFANKNFFSNDTIYSEKGNGINFTVTPGNGEEPYQSPQLKDLRYDNGIYYKLIDRVNPNTGEAVASLEVPLARWEGYLGGMWETIKLRGAYTVPASFAHQQSRVLMPLAVQAGAEDIYEFFPTMRLQIRIKAYSSPSNYSISGTLKHLNTFDVNWKNHPQILYSGPGDVVVKNGGQQTRYAVRFEKGEMTTLQKFDPDTGKPVINDKNAKLEPVVLPLYSGDNVWLEVKAGGRNFSCDPVHIIDVVPNKDTVKPADKVNFQANLEKAMEQFKSIFAVTASPAIPATTPAVKPKPTPEPKLTWNITTKDNTTAKPVTSKPTEKVAAIDQTLNDEGTYLAEVDLTHEGDDEVQVGVGAVWVGVEKPSKLTTDISLDYALRMLPLSTYPINGSLLQWGFKCNPGQNISWRKDLTSGTYRTWDDYNSIKIFEPWKVNKVEKYQYYITGGSGAGIYRVANNQDLKYKEILPDANGAFPNPGDLTIISNLSYNDIDYTKKGNIQENVNIGDKGIFIFNENVDFNLMYYVCAVVRGPFLFKVKFNLNGMNKSDIEKIYNINQDDKQRMLVELQQAQLETRELTLAWMRKIITEFDKWYLRKIGNGPWIKGLCPEGDTWCKDFLSEADAPTGMIVTEKNVKERNGLYGALIEYRKTQKPLGDDELDAYRIEINSYTDLGNQDREISGMFEAHNKIMELIKHENYDYDENKVAPVKITSNNYSKADEAYSCSNRWNGQKSVYIRFRVANLVVSVSGRDRAVKPDVVAANVDKLASKFLSKIVDGNK
jgi:hypothetical protein